MHKKCTNKYANEKVKEDNAGNSPHKLARLFDKVFFVVDRAAYHESA